MNRILGGFFMSIEKMYKECDMIPYIRIINGVVLSTKLTTDGVITKIVYDNKIQYKLN